MNHIEPILDLHDIFKWGGFMFLASMLVVFFLLIPIFLGYLVVLLPFIMILAIPVFGGSYFTWKLLAIFRGMLFGPLKSILRTDSRVKDVLVIDNGDPIQDLSLFYPTLSLRNRDGLESISCRRVVAEKLIEAQKYLGPNLFLLILKCFDNKIKSDENYNSGGVIDIVLTNQFGEDIQMGKQLVYKLNQFGSVLRGVETKEVVKNRLKMARVLSKVGFINDPLRWWRWSYGDQYWCFMTQGKHSIYSANFLKLDPL